MMEVIKSVIWDHGTYMLEGKEVHKYLIGIVMVTNKAIEGITKGDNVAMGGFGYGDGIVEPLSKLPKYKPPYILGDLSTAMIDISKMTIEDMKPSKKNKK